MCGSTQHKAKKCTKGSTDQKAEAGAESKEMASAKSPAAQQQAAVGGGDALEDDFVPDSGNAEASDDSGADE